MSREKKLAIKATVALLVLAFVAAALAACGSGGEDEAVAGPSPDGTLRFRPDPSGKLAYTTPQVEVEAGKRKIEFINPEKELHDLTIDNPQGKKIAQSYALYVARDWYFLNLKPGVYKFYCSVEGHRKAGMEGTLTVE